MTFNKAVIPPFLLTLLGFALLYVASHSINLNFDIIELVRIKAPANGHSDTADDLRVGIEIMCYRSAGTQDGQYGRPGQALCSTMVRAHGKSNPNVDPTLFGEFGSQVTDAIIYGVQGVFSLNFATSAIAEVSVFFVGLAMFTDYRATKILPIVSLGLATVLAWVTFALNIAFAVVTREAVDYYTKSAYRVEIGSVPWLVLLSAISLSLALSANGWTSLARYVAAMSTDAEGNPRRTWPWQRIKLQDDQSAASPA